MSVADPLKTTRFIGFQHGGILGRQAGGVERVTVIIGLGKREHAIKRAAVSAKRFLLQAHEHCHLRRDFALLAILSHFHRRFECGLHVRLEVADPLGAALRIAGLSLLKLGMRAAAYRTRFRRSRRRLRSAVVSDCSLCPSPI